METKPFDIVSLGEPLYEMSQLPGEAGRFLQGFGGDTSNCAIAAARLGAHVAYITRVGDDEFGRQFLSLWQGEGIDVSGVGIDGEAHTAVYFITHGAKGHVFSYLRAASAASRMQPHQLPLGLLNGTRFFHTSGISQAISVSACDSVFTAIQAAKAAGARFVFDANVRPRLWSLPRARAVIGATVAMSDVFLLSVEDGELLTGSSDAQSILDWCHARGAGTVILKLGADGAVASENGRRESVAGHHVECVDATGAGDCFAGTLMARLASGDDLPKALRYANAAAALATTGFGAVGPLPDAAKVEALLNRSAAPGAVAAT